MASVPKPPSAEEVASHFASGHAVYRTWCRHCIAGKARASPPIILLQIRSLVSPRFALILLRSGTLGVPPAA